MDRIAGNADTATISNVLNVIAEPAARDQVIRQAADAIKADGEAYFSVYDGDRSGKGKETPRGYQLNRKLGDYIDEIEKHFGSVTKKGNILIAKEPVKAGAEQDNRKNVGISFMPKNEEEFSYRGGHQGPDENNGAPLHEMTRGIYPDDLYTLPFDTALQYYGDADESGYSRESLSAIRSAKGDPKAKIKIYRAVPKYVGETDPVKTKEVEDRISRLEKLARLNPTSDYFRQELDNALAERPQTIDSINAGDWVTSSRTYAKEHGEAALRGEYKILSKSVPASHLFTEGNSLSEFGYNPPAKKGDISFMPSSKLDEAYAKAIESGDMEEAQRLVDEMARKAGYNSKNVYHFTNNKFNEFDENFQGSQTDDGELGKAFYFTTDTKSLGDKKYRINAKLALNNPLILDKPDWFTKKRNFVTEKLGLPKDATAQQVTKEAKNQGYDGIIMDYSNLGYNHQEISIFDPNQIKSADPATYDDNGKLIPLSQRFDTSKPDIRFMPESKGEYEKVKEKVPSLLPINEQPENLPVVGRLTTGQQQAIDELDKYYDEKTPQRVQELKKDAEESLSSRLTNLGIPVSDSKKIASKAFGDLRKSVKGAMQVISGMGLSDLSRMAGSGRPSVETRQKISPAWLTSAFESFETDDSLALMKAQQVARQLNKADQAKVAAGEDIESAKASGVRQSTIEQGMNFVIGERTADQKAFGSSLREDIDAPPRVYASVVEGQKYGSQGNYNLFFEWDQATPMVITSHHHYGVGNGLTDIHASANIGDKNARSFGDPSSEKYDTLPSGKKVLNTRLLVGNEGASDIRAHQLMVSIPKSGLDDVKRAFKASGTKAAEAEMEKIIASQLVGTPSQGKTQAFTTDEGIPPYVAVQKNRTEAYVLNPDLQNVKRITIVSNKPKEIELITKNLQRSFENNGTKLPKVDVVSKDSGASTNAGRKAITDKFFKLTGKLAFMPETETQEPAKIDWSVFTQKAEKPLSTLRAYANPQQQDEVN
jgi:hypothetical protein